MPFIGDNFKFLSCKKYFMKALFIKKLNFLLLLLSIGITSCVSDATSTSVNKKADSDNNQKISSKEVAIGNDQPNNQVTAGNNSVNVKVSEQKDSPANPQDKTTNLTITTPKIKSDRALPDACTLVNEEFIGNTIEVNSDAITIKDGSISSTSTARSCFFRWEHKGVPNSGVLIQIQENPLPEEINDWAAYFIQAKIHSGDTDPSGGTNFKYKPFEGIGVTGAYNYDMHRYFYRTEDDKVFLIAFNISATEQEELKWAKAIGKEVFNNYSKL